MRLELLSSRQHAADVSLRDLGLSSRSSTTRFEVLRATVWGLTAPKGKAHVNRVLSAALPACQFLTERQPDIDDTLRSELRAALSTLENAGDLIELSGGYWAPATARLVELPDKAGYLLVGGVPSRLLQLEPDAIEFHGPHRRLVTIPAGLAAAFPREDLASWSRLPEVSLADWTREIVDSLERFPYTPVGSDTFEFYLPALARAGAPQFRRWSQSANDVTGTILARRWRLFGAREYRLVDTRSGAIVSSCELPDVDVRRLMYGLDLAAKNPVRARRVRIDSRTEWLLTSELPRAEQRTFAAFGTLTIPEGRYFERRWMFLRSEELALGMLRSLGISLG